MPVFQFTLWFLVLFGHLALWVALFNRLHAWALPRWVIESLEKVYIGVAVLGMGIWIWWGSQASLLPQLAPLIRGEAAGQRLLNLYLAICGSMGLVILCLWTVRGLRSGVPQLIRNDTERFDVAQAVGAPPIGSELTRLLSLIPGHQMFQLHVHEKHLMIKALPEALDGLSIAHFSDLHFTGRITRTYFDFLIDRALECDADVVAVTGDFIDHADCIEWLPETLGRLRARNGVYFVLGNHDVRKGHAARIRAVLRDSGLIDLGGKTHQVNVRGAAVLLAGNEMPWFRPAPRLDECPPPDQAFRILLSHTPDVIGWAREHEFALMLAGHTHGGQIRLPLVGPVVSPSMFGVKYAGGLFYKSPTLMHVTRGVSGKDPIRWNCPPELAKLVLRRQ